MNEKVNVQMVRINEVGQEKESVLVFGHFSTVHPGHIRHIKYARELGEKVIVALLGDNHSLEGINYTQKERAESLNYLDIIDKIVLLEGDELCVAVAKMRPKILLLGKEHENTEENNLMQAIKRQRLNGGAVLFDAGETHYASSELLEHPFRALETKRRKEFQGACIRNNILKGELLKFINEWNKIKLLVVGDTIIDQYAACEALGLSAEAPVVVVRELDTKNFIGGAAVVAGHISALGAKCHYISVVGDDDEGKVTAKTLQDKEISFDLIVDNTRPTTFKKRYMVDSQKLFRVSRLEDKGVTGEVEDEIIKKVEAIINEVDGIVVSDFVYGVITNSLIIRLKKLAKENNIKLFGDVQSSSQVGNITKLMDFNLLCPNEREARIALQDKESGIEALSQKMLSKTKAKNLVMKLGADGFITYGTGIGEMAKCESFPALTVNPVDVTGAGDSLLSLMSIGLSADQDIIACSALACCLAATAVEMMGNNPVGRVKLIQKIEEAFS